jgi:hypothetical protein
MPQRIRQVAWIFLARLLAVALVMFLTFVPTFALAIAMGLVDRIWFAFHLPH